MSLIPSFPKSYEELEALPPSSMLYQDPLRPAAAVKVVTVAPGVLIKYGGSRDYSEEINVLRFALALKVIPVPKTIQHPPLRRQQPPSGAYVPWKLPKGAWYICMERCQGVSLDEVIRTMEKRDLDHVAHQLKDILTQMASVKSNRFKFGSVTGGPYRNGYFPHRMPPKHAFETCTEFIDYFRNLMLYFCTESFTDEFLSKFPRYSPLRFTHGDLLPYNIIVDGSTITGIIDWEMGGFYPEFWEHGCMHAPTVTPSNSPNWQYVLSRVFPGPRRQAEIDGVNRLLSMLTYNL